MGREQNCSGRVPALKRKRARIDGRDRPRLRRREGGGGPGPQPWAGRLGAARTSWRSRGRCRRAPRGGILPSRAGRRCGSSRTPASCGSPPRPGPGLTPWAEREEISPAAWPHRSTAGRRAGRGIGGEAGPADAGRDGLGAGPPAIPAVGGRYRGNHPAEKNAATGRSARRVSRLDRENGALGLNPARSGQQPDIEAGRGLITLSSKCVRQLFACGRAAALPSASTLRDVQALPPPPPARRPWWRWWESLKDHPSAAVPPDSSSHERLEPSDSLLCDGQLDRGVRPRPRRGRPEGQELVKDSVLDLQLPGGKPASRKPSGLHPPRDRRGLDARSLSRLRRVHDHHPLPCIAMHALRCGIACIASAQMLSDTSGLAEGVLGRVSCRTSWQAWYEMWEAVNRPRVAHDGGSIPPSVHLVHLDLLPQGEKLTPDNGHQLLGFVVLSPQRLDAHGGWRPAHWRVASRTLSRVSFSLPASMNSLVELLGPRVV